jgi:hypothetical protein
VLSFWLSRVVIELVIIMLYLSVIGPWRVCESGVFKPGGFG